MQPTFALIHGGFHGGWCFERLQEALKARGFKAVAPDTPIDDPSATWHSFTDAVMEALGQADGPVVVVGHSLGGMTTPLVAERLSDATMIFLQAPIPEPGLSLNEQRRRQTTRPHSIDVARCYHTGTDGLTRIDPECAREAFLYDCSEADTVSVLARLRPQSYHIFDEPCPLAAWPDVPAHIILGEEDHSHNNEVTIQGGKRIGASVPRYIPGGHSPFYAHPEKLAEMLIDLGSH
jgi:pimeloyl-ACP methyl ester carboxylesterase